MAKITTITPVHISSGNTINYFKKNGLLYPIDAVFDLVEFKEELRTALLNSTKASQNSFARLLNVNNIDIDVNMALNASKEYGVYAKNEAKLIEHIKSMENLYIPGSSIKGAIFNVFWYHVLKDNFDIRRHIIKTINENKFNIKNINKEVDRLEREMAPLKALFRVRDAMFSGASKAIETARLSKKGINSRGQKNSAIPVGSVEVIWQKQSLDLEFVIGTKKELDNALNEINKKNDNLLNSLAKDLYDFILNFNEVYPKMNREYMAKVINKELDFACSITNQMVNKNLYKNIVNNIYELSKTKVVMQIGKFTNFLDKSCFFALGEVYEGNFKKIFTPNPKNKSISSIDTCNLMLINGSYYLPFGYIQIDL